jgi:predicted TIM-barrel fold metal-dependent hydrolase
LSDLIADTAGLPVEKFIHIQAHMGTEDPSRETAWLQEISSTAGNPRGVIGFAALADPGVETVLANHSRYPVHRGIRQSVNWHSDRFYSMCDRSDYLTDSAWQRGYGLLAKYKMSFELQAFPHQLNDAAALAVRFPDVVMVVEHCGFPIDRSAGGMAHWRSGMRRLVELPNTVVKISALVIMDHEWTAESLRPIIRETVEIFGPSRAMFGSNFPIDKVYIKYPETVKAVAGALDDLTEDELDQVFYRTALKTYRL